MNPINNIPGLIQELKKFEKEDELRRIDIKKESGKEKISDTKTSSGVDNVKISTAGKKLLRQKMEISRYLDEIKNLETKSQKEIQNVQQKIADDYYSKTEVLNKIAESIIKLPTFQNIVKKNTTKDSGNVLSKLDEDRLAEIQERIKKGKYNTQEVIDVIAERILNSS